MGGVSGLLPPSRWHLARSPGWAKGEGEGKIICLGKTEGRREKTRRSEEEEET